MKTENELVLDVEEISRQVLEALDNQREECDFQKREIEKLSNIIKERDETIDTYVTKAAKEQNDFNGSSDQEKILRFTENVQSDLKCSICHDMILFSTATNCGHLFCEDCIHTWIQESSTCPICRIMVTSLGKVRRIDNFIAVFVETFMTEEYRETRSIRKRENRRELDNMDEGNSQDTQINPILMNNTINLESLRNSMEANIRYFEENVTSYERNILNVVRRFEEVVVEYGNAANLLITNFNSAPSHAYAVENDNVARINAEIEDSRRYLSEAIETLFENYTEHRQQVPTND